MNAVLGWWWCALSAAAGVVVEGAAEDRPVEVRQGVEVVLAVTDDAGEPRSGETVRVIHRPGLAGEAELAIGISDGRGRVRWTPEMSGVAKIRAGEASLPLRVVPVTPPLAVPVTLGLLLLTAAGSLGYAAFGPAVRLRPRP